MKKILTSALLVVAVAAGAVALPAGCQGGRHGRHGDRERFVTNRVEGMLDEVKATPAQREQILAIKDRLLADGKALHAGHAGVKQQLLAQWQSDRPDAAAVHALVDARAAEMKRFGDEVADAVLQVHQILTPEQRAIVAKKLQPQLQE